MIGNLLYRGRNSSIAELNARYIISIATDFFDFFQLEIAVLVAKNK